MNIHKYIENLKENPEACASYLNVTYRKLAKIIGVEAVIALHAEYGGGFMSLPKKLLSDEYLQQCICEEYDGTNARELAKSLDCTYSWILKVIKRKGGD